jgi:cyclase
VRHALNASVLVVLAAVAGVSAQPGSSARISVLHVQGNVHLLVGAGPNITLQVGKDGVLLVDTPPSALVPQVMAEIRKLSDKPVRYIVNTSANPEHIAGNAALALPAGGRGTGGAPFASLGLARPAIVAHESVLNRLSNPPAGQPATPPAALPTTEYFLPSMDFSFNGEPIVVSHQPSAHSDGDSLVFFRRSDVISAGDVFTPDRYPAIDLYRGGSVQGLIASLNRILAMTVPESFQEGGTYVIPGHGRISEEIDVAEYRDMVVIVRDRVQDLMKKGMTVEQVKAAKPSSDYDGEYGASGATAFVESVYRSLGGK